MGAEELMTIYLCIIIMEIIYPHKSVQENTKACSIDIISNENENEQYSYTISIGWKYRFQNGKYVIWIDDRYPNLTITCEINFAEVIKIRLKKGVIRSHSSCILPLERDRFKLHLLFYQITGYVYQCVTMLISNKRIQTRNSEVDYFTKGSTLVDTKPIQFVSVRINFNHLCIADKCMNMMIQVYPKIHKFQVPLYMLVNFNSKLVTKNKLFKNLPINKQRMHNNIFQENIYHKIPISEQKIHKRVKRSTNDSNRCSLHSNNCHVLDNNTMHAGKVRNVTAKCKHKDDTDKWYYEISWKPPLRLHSTMVTHYLVAIFNYGMEEDELCFQLSWECTRFEFNYAVGFNINIRYTISVIAEPVVRNHDKYTGNLIHKSFCPPTPVINKLSNGRISMGHNYTFKCSFKNVPDAHFTWSFIHHGNCDKNINITYISKYTIRNNSKHIHIIGEKHEMLQITYATEKQQGCYICRSQGITELGFTYHASALLSVSDVNKHRKYGSIDAIGVGVCVGIFVVVVVTILCVRFKNKIRVHLSNIFFIRRRGEIEL